MSCLGDCLDMSPPPDSILFMPPPPVPLFLFPDPTNHNLTNCFATHTCDAAAAYLNHKGAFRNLDRIEYVEMPRKELEEKWNVSGIGDTWLLVLVASSIGVLLLGALLAMFLLKCREMHLLSGSDHCSLHARDLRPMKNVDANPLANTNGKLIHPVNNASFYTPAPSLHDNRMVWAAITPRGTEHFISENYSRNLVCYEPPEDHYETIDNLAPKQKGNHHNGNHVAYYGYHKDYDYEDPTPLIESYQMNDIEYVGDHQYQIIGNTDMRCSSLGYDAHTLKRQYPTMKPMISSPTRIEHPNLPPLNMFPQRSANNTLKKNSLSYRSIDAGKVPKYGL